MNVWKSAALCAVALLAFAACHNSDPLYATWNDGSSTYVFKAGAFE